MSLEAELRTHYAEVHRRLDPPPPPKRRFKAKLPPQSTETITPKKIVQIPISIDGQPDPRPIPPPEFLPTPITLVAILKLVCEVEGFTVIDMRSGRRPRPLTNARLVYYHLCRRYTQKSFPQIAAFLGNRDHTTALYGANRCVQLMGGDECWRAHVGEYEAKLSPVANHGAQV